MEIKNYLDFDLLVQRSEAGYTAKVLNSPTGQASVEFDVPFSDLEVENFILRVGRTRKGVRRLESSEMVAAKEFGGRLFRSVFKDEVRNCLDSSLNEAISRNSGLRIRLRLSDAPELVDLPWEYLYNATVNRFLVLSVDSPLVRYLDLPGRVTPLAVTPPLRILVVISSPQDFAQLDAEQEWKNLKGALSVLEKRGLVILERTTPSTLSALQRQLRSKDYHIFHFIGHGGFDSDANDGVLVFESENGRSHAVSGQYVGMLLHDQKTIRLAVLNACEGGRTSRTDPFAGVGQSLLQQGIPSVLAMQFEITDEAAITLSQEFYTALAEGFSVEAALAEARKGIFAQGNDIEWGTPVLYLRASNSRIFDIETSSDAIRGSDAPTPIKSADMRSGVALLLNRLPLNIRQRVAAVVVALFAITAIIFFLQNSGIKEPFPSQNTDATSIAVIESTLTNVQKTDSSESVVAAQDALLITTPMVTPSTTASGLLSTSGLTTSQPELASCMQLDIDVDSATSDEIDVAQIWNQYRTLLTEVSQDLQIDPAVAVAIVAAEWRGKPFTSDGRMVIRFENHIFYQYWGRFNQERFEEHFEFNEEENWKEHRWRINADQAWQDVHTSQDSEWEVFEFAYSELDKTAALMSISMGGLSTMGFQYASLGYSDVHEMFEAYKSSGRAQVLSLFEFIKVQNLVDSLRNHDFVPFASAYHGQGYAEKYESILYGKFETFKDLASKISMEGC